MLSSTCARRQRGFTLLDALVALVITALAILGVTGVQLRTLADTRTGVHRAQAVRLIEDLSERLKVNPNALTTLDSYAQSWDATSTSAPTCASGCTASDYASHDIAQWRQTVQATLPGGQANTFLVSDETVEGARRQLGVMISWRQNERRREGESDAEATAYRQPFEVSVGSGTSAVSCSTGHICHLQFIQPSMRCAPDRLIAENTIVLRCPAKPTPAPAPAPGP